MSLSYVKTALLSLKPAFPVIVSIVVKSNDETMINIQGAKSFRAASIIKLFILATYYHLEELGQLSLEEEVVISEDKKVGGAGVLSYLTHPHSFTYQQLLELMIIVSDNTASNYLIDKVGISTIQSFIRRIGCSQTMLERKFMDVTAQKQGKENFTSALDVIRLFDIFTEDNYFLGASSQQNIMKILQNQQLNSKITTYTAYDASITSYHKTGELLGAEHDAAIFVTEDQLLKVVVLTDDWKNNGDGQSFITSFSKVLHRYLQQ